ncbi:hypothetical protein RP20_CCG007991 [Aedes albopictus]|nr:hypothetical protein RP20_CCG007991 [Aedes albopictus]
MFGRRFRDKFPQVGEDPILEDEVKDRDLIHKYRAKQYRDRRVNAQPSDIEIGDHVLMRQQHRENKLAPNYHPDPAVVIDKNGSCVTVKTGGGIYRRNSSHLKRIPRELNERNSSAEVQESPISGPSKQTQIASDSSSTSAGQEQVTRTEHEHWEPPRNATAIELPEAGAMRSRRQVKIPVKYKDYEM